MSAETLVAAKLAALAELDPERARRAYTTGIANTETAVAAHLASAAQETTQRNTGAPAAQAVADIIGAGANPRLEQMRRDRELDGGYVGALGQATGRSLDQAIFELPAIAREAEGERARRGGGRGGGGRGGGGGGGGGSGYEDQPWWNWYEEGGERGSAWDLFGPQSSGMPSLVRHVKEVARDEYDRRSAPAWARRREVLSTGFGAPAQTASGRFEMGPAAKAWLPQVRRELERGRDPRRVLSRLQGRAIERAGDQGPLVNMVAQELGLKKTPKKKFLKKYGKK